MIRWIVNGFIIVAFFSVFAVMLTMTDWDSAQQPSGVTPEQIGYSMFTTYGAAFEVASLLLLAAMVGAVFLVRRTREEPE